MSKNLSALARKTLDPAQGGFAVTKSDSTLFDNNGTNQPAPRAIYVGGAGDLAVEFVDGTQVVFASVGAGTLLPINVRKVLSTGTTATSIVGVY